MQIIVQCECGQKFGMSIEDKTYRSKDYAESFMGSKHCTNPECDKTVYVNADIHSSVASDEEENNPKFYWEEIEEGNEIFYAGNYFEVVYKRVLSVQNTQSKELIYVRSLTGGGNLILEVRQSGFLSLFNHAEIEHTKDGSIMWGTKDIETIKKKQVNEK